jgi:hypothetical protein
LNLSGYTIPSGYVLSFAGYIQSADIISGDQNFTANSTNCSISYKYFHSSGGNGVNFSLVVTTKVAFPYNTAATNAMLIGQTSFKIYRSYQIDGIAYKRS